jgi:hypothetical protein
MAASAMSQSTPPSTSRVAISESGETLRAPVDVAEGHVDHRDRLQ